MKSLLIFFIFVLIGGKATLAEECEEYDEFGDLDSCKEYPINVRANLIPLLTDTAMMGLDFSTSDYASIGFDLGYTYDTDLVEGVVGKAYRGGIRVTYFVDTLHKTSLIALIGLSKIQYKLDEVDKKESSEATAGYLRSGYRWLWKESGFNVIMAAGVGQSKPISSKYLKERLLSPEVEISLGYQL